MEAIKEVESLAKIITSLTEERDELHRLIGIREAELVWLKKICPVVRVNANS